MSATSCAPSPLWRDCRFLRRRGTGDSQFEGVREKAGEQLMTGCGRSMDSRVWQAELMGSNSAIARCAFLGQKILPMAICHLGSGIISAGANHLEASGQGPWSAWDLHMRQGL